MKNIFYLEIDQVTEHCKFGQVLKHNVLDYFHKNNFFTITNYLNNQKHFMVFQVIFKTRKTY